MVITKEDGMRSLKRRIWLSPKLLAVAVLASQDSPARTVILIMPSDFPNVVKNELLGESLTFCHFCA